MSCSGSVLSTSAVIVFTQKCLVTTYRNHFCRVTLWPFGKGKSAPFTEPLLIVAHLLSDAPAVVTHLTLAINPALCFVLSGGGRTCWMCQSVQLCTTASRKELNRAHWTSGGEGIAEICWFLVTSAGAKEAQEPLWNSWTQHISC